MNDHRAHLRILAATGITAGIIASPYLLPAIGIGTAEKAEAIAGICSQTASAAPLGLAGALHHALACVPGIGSSLVAGGLTTALWSGGIGIGGALLGNYVHKHYDHEGGIPWGKIIKYAALATSLLVALPSILSGVTMGLAFLATTAFGVTVGSNVYGWAAHSLGLAGGSAAAGMAGITSHLVTCGAALVPAAGTAMLTKQKDESAEHTRTTTTRWTTRVTQSHMDQEAAGPVLA